MTEVFDRNRAPFMTAAEMEVATHLRASLAILLAWI